MEDLNNLGSYSSINALWSAYPEGGHEGDYAFIGSTKYRWNKYDRIWEAAATITQRTARRREIVTGDMEINNNLQVDGNLKLLGTLIAQGVKQPARGLFPTIEDLRAAYPNPEVGDWACVGNTIPTAIWICTTAGIWSDSGNTGGMDSLDMSVIESMRDDIEYLGDEHEELVAIVGEQIKIISLPSTIHDHRADPVTVNVKAGEHIRVAIQSEYSLPTFVLWVRYAGHNAWTNTQYSIPINDGELTYMAQEDIVELGIYGSNIPTATRLRLTVTTGLRLDVDKLQELTEKHDKDIVELESHVGNQSVKFSIPYYSHAYDNDTIRINLSAGDKITVKCETEQTGFPNGNLFAHYAANDSWRQLEESKTIPVNGSADYTANGAIDMLGFYFENSFHLSGEVRITVISAMSKELEGIHQDIERLSDGLDTLEESVEELSKIHYSGMNTRHIANLKNDAVDSFMFFTDPHTAGSNNNFDEQHFLGFVKGLTDIYRGNPLDFVLSGGNWLNSGDSREVAVKKLAYIDTVMRRNIDRYYPILGNHDTNYQGGTSEGSQQITDTQLAALMFREFGKSYYSFKRPNSTFIVLDTGLDRFRSEEGGLNAHDWEQVDYVGKFLEQTSEQNIIIAEHIYSIGQSVEQWEYTRMPFPSTVMDILLAYNNRETISKNYIDYDFRQATGKVRCVICGQANMDYVDSVRDIPVIVTRNAYDSGVLTLDMVVFNYTTSKAYLTRVGQGSDRVINLA